MKCYHVTDVQPPLAGFGVHHWLNLPDGKFLVIHEDAESCPDETTCMGHVLDHATPIPAHHAHALSCHEVTETDTVAQAMLKVGKHWKKALP